MARSRSPVRIIPGHFRNVKGVEHLQRLIAALPVALTAELKPVVIKNGLRLLNDIKMGAPVSELEANPGELKANYRFESAGHELAIAIVGDAKSDDGKVINKHVEHGHKAADGSKVAPVPHVYPAARRAKPRFAADVARATTRGVKAARGQAGGSDVQ